MVDWKRAWADQAHQLEDPILRELAVAALSQNPSPSALRDLATGAAVVGELTPPQEAQALSLIRWAFEESPASAWDAAHAAGELRLPTQQEPLLDLLAGVLQAANRFMPSARARAAEAYALLADPEQAVQALDALKDDDSWTVRRLAKDAARNLNRDTEPRGDLFSRVKALIRTERIRMEVDEEPLNAADLAKLGLRLPASLLQFLATVFIGGRAVLLEEDLKGNKKDGESYFLTPPGRLVGKASAQASDLQNYNEYVYTRYIDGARKYPKVDEDYALKRYKEYYDRGWVDMEAYNYGVLLFEAAFRDVQGRGLHLLRCRNVLSAYQAMSGEEWDAVDDRLLEAEDIIKDEGHSWSGEQPVYFQIGVWGGVIELSLDLEGPGLYARDPDVGPGRWKVAGSVAAFLNNPEVRRPGDEGELDPITLLEQAGDAMDAGQKKQAARLFGDVLEQHRAPKVLAKAAELLQRDDMDALSAAQLLSTILMVGDRKSAEAVRAVLQSLPVELAVEMVNVVAPHDEDGSQIALFVNAAAGVRKRTHAAVKAAAKQLKDVRGKAHIRTLRNPWYKKK